MRRRDHHPGPVAAAPQALREREAGAQRVTVRVLVSEDDHIALLRQQATQLVQRLGEPVPTVPAGDRRATRAGIAQQGLLGRRCVAASFAVFAVLLGHQLPQSLGDPHRVLDGRVELEAELRGEAEVGQAPTQLMPDQTGRRTEPGQGPLLLGLVAEDRDAYACQPQVRRHADLRDAGEADARVLQLAADDLHDLLPDLRPDLIGAVAGHGNGQISSSSRRYVSITSPGSKSSKPSRPTPHSSPSDISRTSSL